MSFRGGSSSPTGAAGGELAGTYPNPTLAAVVVRLAPAASTTNVIQPTGAAVIPLIVEAAAAQSADLQQWQNSAAAVGGKISADGKRLSIGTGATVQVGDTSGGVSGLQIGSALCYGSGSGLRMSGSLQADALITNLAGMRTAVILSGALPTIAPVSGTGLQCSTTRDVFLIQVCTFNPSAGAAATCLVELSPDNVTYSALITVTFPAGVVFDTAIPPIGLQVPAAWRVRFTTTNATLGTGTYY